MKQPQKAGYVYKRAGWWVLRYRQTSSQGGELKTVHRAERIIPVGPEHKTEASVRKLRQVEEKLREVNQSNQQPGMVITLVDFMEQIFLPHIAEQKRPSTAKSYRDIWKDHLATRAAGVLLRDVKTSTVQRWLTQIAAQDRTRNGTPLTRETLKHIKSAISGIFRLAKQQDYTDKNPVQGTDVPKGAKSQETHAYSLAEVNRMLELMLSPMASAILAVAASTGLRRGEIEGLRWEDWQVDGIRVSRSRWNGQELEPKTQASAAPVPVIPSLARKLVRYRAYLGNPISGSMFPGARMGKPVSLNNVLRREILPAFAKAGIEWHGWHAFRRGLATNLHDQGVPDKTIQTILRHSNVSVTQRCYIKTLDSQTKAAMHSFDAALNQLLTGKESELCADLCATGGRDSAVN